MTPMSRELLRAQAHVIVDFDRTCPALCRSLATLFERARETRRNGSPATAYVLFARADLLYTNHIVLHEHYGVLDDRERRQAEQTHESVCAYLRSLEEELWGRAATLPAKPSGGGASVSFPDVPTEDPSEDVPVVPTEEPTEDGLSVRLKALRGQ